MITWTGIGLLLIVSAHIAKVDAQRATSLTIKIKELVPIARLTNGIALETEILTDPKKMNDVIAEFLGIRSGDDLVNLKGMDVDGVVSGLGEIYTAAEQVPDMNVDVQAFKDSFEALDTMKGYSDVLTSNSGNDVTKIGSDMDSASSSGAFRKIESFQNAADSLTTINTNSFVDTPKVENGFLYPLKEAIENIQASFSKFKTFDQTFGDLLHLYNTATKLSRLANVSELLIANLDTLSTMGSKLTALKSGVDQLKPVIDKQKSIPQLTKTLNDTIIIIKTSTEQTPDLNLTIGFSGSVNSFAILFQDLKTDYLKKIVSRGKDLKDMADSLNLLSKFQNKMQEVHRIWSAAVPDDWTSTEETVRVLSDMSDTNQNVPDTSTVSTTLTSIQQCFSSFQRPSTVPKLTDVSTISIFASNLSQQISEWKTFFEEKESDFATLNTNLGTLVRALEPINTDPKNSKREEVWNSIRNQPDNMKTVSLLTSIHEGLDRLLKNSPFKMINGPKPVLSVINDIVSSLNGPNLPSLLNCLGTQSNGLTDITTMLTIGSSVQAMKTKKQSFQSLQTLFSDVAKVKNGVVDIGNTMVSSKRRRRRRAANSKSLKNLKNAQEVSYHLGLGIQVLHKFVEILEKQDSVMVAVDAVDPLASAVAAIPGSQTVWTSRDKMGVMIDDLNKLETTAANLKKDNLADLWKIFSEAKLVPGVSIDATLFDDPISKQLAQNPDPTIQEKSMDFKEIGTLDLNFVQHHVNLQKASQTLAPLQTFFDDFFGNNPAGQDAGSDGTFSIATIAVSILLFSLFTGAAGVGIWFVRQRIQEKQRWKHRERNWVHDRISELTIEMDTAIQKNLYPTVRDLLKRGQYPNYYINYNLKKRAIASTCLYMAVDLGKPVFVEMLIRAGADRRLRSSDGLTPEELLKKKLERKTGGGEEKQDEEKKEEGGNTEEGTDNQEGNQEGDQEKQKDDEAGKEKEAKKEGKKEEKKEDTKKEEKSETEEERAYAKDAENPAKLEEIRKIFEKYEKKKFRPRVPDPMPINKFQISVRSGARDEQEFKKRFEKLFSVGTTEVKQTHWVCKTDKNGVLDVENMKSKIDNSPCYITHVRAVLSSGILLVKESWLDACLKNKKNLHNDHEHRITRFRYNGKVYDTVQEWQKWGLEWAVPCLFNVRVAYVVDDETSQDSLKLLLEHSDATPMELEELIADSSTRNDQRPYWFPDMNCHWVLYPKAEKAKFDATWKKTKEKCKTVDQKTPFVIMTLEKFFDKLLSLNGYKDLLAEKYPQDGEGQKKGTVKTKDQKQKPKDKKPAKSPTEQTKSNEKGSGSMQGSGTKSLTPKSPKSPKSPKL